MRISKLILGVILLNISQGCVTIFSDFQSADTLGKGNTEITPGSSLVTFSNEGESEHIQTNLGVQLGVGITDNLDARFRLEAPSIGDSFETFGDYFVLGAGPKFKIAEDRVSGYVPVGFAFGQEIESSETFEVQPTLLISIPINELIEINSSMKYILPFSSERDAALALNLGFGFWNENIGIRPEIGFMKSLEESEGTFMHYGIAISFRSSNKN